MIGDEMEIVQLLARVQRTNAFMEARSACCGT
eukprot:SAG22_NODE_20672_length_263_cov_1.579268_1_plen_31_part_10